MNIVLYRDCIVRSHIAINQPKLSDASRSSPTQLFPIFVAWFTGAQPTLLCCKAVARLPNVVECTAEVNAGSLSVLSDHIADHSGPGGEVNLQHFRLHRNSDHSFSKTPWQTQFDATSISAGFDVYNEVRAKIEKDIVRGLSSENIALIPQEAGLSERIYCCWWCTAAAAVPLIITFAVHKHPFSTL